MAGLRFILGFLSPLALVAAVFLIAEGVKGDPQDLSQALEGALLFGIGLLCFPPQGHPMHRISQRLSSKPPAHVQPETRKPPLTPEAAQQLKEMIDFNIDALTFEPRPRPWHAGWCRLDLAIDASENASSWVGGLPEMPEDVSWPTTPRLDDYPELEGRHMVFLAQIAIRDLPANVWDGLGPSDGWLLFFCDPRFFKAVRVLHIRERGPVRHYPSTDALEDMVPYDTNGTLRTLGRSVSDFLPLKFALNAIPLPPAADEPLDRYAKNKCDVNPRRNLRNADVLELPFRPDQPEQAFAMVAAFEHDLKQQSTSPYGPKRGTAEGDARAEQFDAALVETARLKTKVTVGISPEALLQNIERIEDGLVMPGIWKTDYMSAVEYMARETFLRDPSSLPADIRNAFEPVWRFDAEYEAVSMSGEVSRGYTYTVTEEPVLLLQLPPSDLIGWMIGDVDTFGIFIKPEDLKAGRWENAWGDIIN